MLLLFAIVAAANLCIGYVLGATFGVLPGIVRREPEGDSFEQDELLLRPPAPEESPPQVVERSEPASVSTPSELPSADPTEELLDQLSAFRAKLAKVHDGLRQADSNLESLGQCAKQLRQANHDYAEGASHTIGRLDAETELATALQQQTEAVHQANTTIDQLLTNSDTPQLEQGLISTTSQLNEHAVRIENSVAETRLHGSDDHEQAARSPRAVDREQLLGEAARQLACVEPGVRLQMAGISFDERLADGTTIEVNPRLVDGLLQVVEQLLEEGQLTAVDEGRLLMLLTGDDETTAIQRCERLRQQVAATTFVCEGATYKLTASCSVADSAVGLPVQQIVTHVEESLVEARRYGPNRCFHHDGKFPAPVVPHTMGVDELTLEV